MLTDENYMKMAEELETASKCVSRQVGALIVKDGRIISTGYNGTPAGYKNCDTHWNGEHKEEHHEWSKLYEIHAEMNAIIFASKSGVDIDGATVYCTVEPCSECSKNIIQTGIKRIVYRRGYEFADTKVINQFLKDCGVVKEQIK